MPLTPAFVLSAVNPWSYGYIAQFPSRPYVNATLTSYGGYSNPYSGYSLTDQVANDELIIGCDPAELDDENDITDLTSQVVRRNAIAVRLDAHNVRTDHQYLLVFGFRRRAYDVTVQFFVGADWIRSELIDNEHDTVALLLDAPGSDSVDLFVRLAADSYWRHVGLTGVEGFII